MGVCVYLETDRIANGIRGVMTRRLRQMQLNWNAASLTDNCIQHGSEIFRELQGESFEIVNIYKDLSSDCGLYV